MIYVLVAILLLCGFLMVFISLMKPAKRAKLSRKVYLAIYNFYLARGLVQKITFKISQLSIYRSDEIPKITIKYMLKALAWSGVLVFAGIFLFEDIISKILCFIFAVVMYGNVVDKQIDKVFLKVLKETKRILSAIEQGYLSTKSIPDAISEAETGGLLSKALDEIYSILTGSNGELRLQQFYAAMPFKPLQTLAGVCYNINLYGDSDNGQGISGFIQAITILRGDVNSQIEKLTLQKAKFGRMEYMPIASVFLITPVENYFISAIPGIVLIYNGLSGFILRAVTILSAIIGYTVISRINSAVVVKADDRNKIITKLLNFGIIKSLIKSLIPKKGKTRRFKEHRLGQAISKMPLEHYYLKKVACSVIAFASTLMIIFIACGVGSDYVKNTTDQLSLVAGKERTIEQKRAVIIMDEIYFELEGKLSENEHKQLINRYLPGLSDMEIFDEIKRMQDKYSNWKELYFKYVYVWVAFIIGILGYFIPDFILIGRRKFIKTEKEDDYMQLQTLVSVLTFTDIDSLAVLGQMVQHSTVHKDYLLQAYHNFPSAPELALERLKSQITLQEFKWFIDKLKLTISELPMTEAFSDLIAERENFMRLRHITMQATLAKKQVIGKILSMLPLILFAVSEFAFPIAYLGFTQFSGAMSMLG